MEEGEPTKNNLPLDPISTKYHVTDEDVEIMTGKIGNKITIEQQMTHSTEKAEIVTEVLKELGDLPKAPDFNEEEIESSEHIVVEHQNESLTLEGNTGNETPLHEFGDYRDILQHEIFIQHVKEAIEVEVGITEEPIQEMNGTAQPPSQMELNDYQPNVSAELLQQRKSAVTCTVRGDLEDEHGKMAQVESTTSQRQRKKKVVLLSEIISDCARLLLARK
ncbi:Hypothetical predicted protein [Olea europaea subsp. europaea]|uniref:Uncharacterized protein n=1 Tax=Olea europaea subsp. europaea TaxID=158383 RepID=A0A8S0SBL3_OLEEU|nr:Hypothetical predicted protein [Olea europaea subsp. europaea]